MLTMHKCVFSIHLTISRANHSMNMINDPIRVDVRMNSMRGREWNGEERSASQKMKHLQPLVSNTFPHSLTSKQV